MSSVSLKNITKRFGSSLAVDNVSIELPSGSFLTLLGPSGCGKTTTLRILAGLEAADSGRVYLDDEDVTTVPTFQRNIGMVFQSLALFPHMTVGENVGFGLAMRGLRKSEATAKVGKALSLVHLRDFTNRWPHELSGGQQQRVALARALVYEPKILLLDEPFAALDRKLREAMQTELRQLTRAIGITSIFVTHDQEEALVMSDIVAVMNAGIIEQCGPPLEVYERPSTRFVADFMGFRNIFEGKLIRSGDGQSVIGLLGAEITIKSPPVSSAAQSIVVAIRPQKLRISQRSPAGSNFVHGELASVSYHGSSTLYEVNVRGTSVFVQETDRTVACDELRVGGPAVVSWEPEAAQIFSR